MALKQCEEEASEGLYLNDKGWPPNMQFKTCGPHVVHSVNALELVRL